MVARISHSSVKPEIFIGLFISLLSIIGFSNKTSAQGWTFTFSIEQSGPCSVGAPVISLPSMPNFGIPTQSQCEALRQTLLAIKSSIPMYNDQGVYIGDCSAYVSCTPCTGSDIVNASQVSPGEVSFDGQFQGKPLFTTHESSAFEDWAKDYKQQLASYGITSILGNTLTPPQIPLTGDKDFDAFYNGQTENFNPTTPPAKPPKKEENLSVISDKPIPILGGSPLTAEERERQKFGPTYIDQANMFSQATDGEINKNGNDHPLIDLTREIGVTAAGWLPGAAGYVGILATNVISEDAKAIKDIWDGKECPSTETIFNNAYDNTKKDIKEKVVGDFKEEGINNISEKAYGQVVGGAVSTSFKNYNYVKDAVGIVNKIKDYNWKYGSDNNGY